MIYSDMLIYRQGINADWNRKGTFDIIMMK